MSIYLYKNNEQAGPYEESDVREWLQNGQISPNDPAIREGMTEWQPLSYLLEFQAPSPTNMPTGRLKNEIRLLEQYNDELTTLKTQFAEADSNTQKRIQHQIDQKMQIYWKQIQMVKSQFPGTEAATIHEAAFYTLQAIIKLFSSGMMRRVSDRSSGFAIGLATGLIAKQQEKNNAIQSLSILDQALRIYDYPGARFAKASIYQILGQNPQALAELNYVIANFPDDEVYIEARQLKDEIENPPKKGMCFVATAAYGSPLSPEVDAFRDFRDEVLLKSDLGSAFVEFYYRLSPPVAAIISKSGILRMATRNLLLSPILRLLKYAKTKS